METSTTLRALAGRVVKGRSVNPVIIRWRDPPLMVVDERRSNGPPDPARTARGGREAWPVEGGCAVGAAEGGGDEVVLAMVALQRGRGRPPLVPSSSLSLSVVASVHSGSLQSTSCAARTKGFSAENVPLFSSHSAPNMLSSRRPESNHRRQLRFSRRRPFCRLSLHLVKTARGAARSISYRNCGP